jgi:hypothetical protein
MNRALLCAGVLFAAATVAQAECVAFDYCATVNRHDTRIFTARVLNPIDDGFAWHVHVTRAFLGATKADVDVYVNGVGEYLTPAKLDVGREYVFVVHLEWMPAYRRILTTGVSCAQRAVPWTDVGPGDRRYFEGLHGAQADAQIFGDVDVVGPSYHIASISGARVRLRRRNGEEIAVVTTDADGHFEFRGLSPGDYFVTADMPRRQFERDPDTDDGNVSLLPHACQDLDLWFRRRDGKH